MTPLVAPNWMDRTVAWLAPKRGRDRLVARAQYGALVTGYDGATPSRKRGFFINGRSGDSLTQAAARPLREQARHLERNHDIMRGALDRLTDFIAGPHGVAVEPQPKRRDGTIHTEFAALLTRRWRQWSEWPEVTWRHDWGAVCRLATRSWLRDGDAFGQLIIGGHRPDVFGSAIPVAIELMEADMVPLSLDDEARNIHQGVQRNEWGRPIGYYVLKQHPGDTYSANTMETVRVDAERMMHLALTDRIHQIRGVSIAASVITRLQDVYEYEDSERIAAKMGASLVLKMTHGTPDMWSLNGGAYDPAKQPAIMQTQAGMVVVNSGPGEDAEFFDTKRPNPNAEPFVESQLRRAAAGFGLGYSSLSRNYNGTYSAQRQELVENRPHYEAGTAVLVAQFARPIYQAVADAVAIMDGIPRDLDIESLHDADYMGPPLIWIDPEKEAKAALIQTQACFRSSSSVIRERGGSLLEVYKQIQHEQQQRKELGLNSSVDVAAAGVRPIDPTASDPAPRADSKVVLFQRN